MKKYTVEIRFTEKMLASSPQDVDIYQRFIESRKRVDAEERGDEVATIPAEEVEAAGSSVFHRDKEGLFIFDYKLRGFLKEAAAAVTGKAGLAAYKSKIDKWLFVEPRRLHLANGAGILQKPHGTESRPIRAMTARGPRVSLKRSEYVEPETHFGAELVILPLGEKEINETMIREWLDYGKFCGIGEWRTGSYGRFTYELTAR